MILALILTFISGSCCGYVIAGVMCAAHDADAEQEKHWKEKEK